MYVKNFGLGTKLLVSNAFLNCSACVCFCTVCKLKDHSPAVVVFAKLVTVLLVLLPNTAVTLAVHLLPALRECIVCVTASPATIVEFSDICCESHKSEHM